MAYAKIENNIVVYKTYEVDTTLTNNQQTDRG